MNILVVLLLSIAIISFAIFFYIWYRLRKSLRVASDPSKDTPSKYHLKYETRSFKTADGISLSGWYIPAKNPKAVVICIHGYVDTKATILDHAVYLHDGGYTTFFIDLRSDHPKTKYTLGVQEWKDIEAAYEYMKSLPENKNKKIGFFSGSMGAATVLVATGKTNKGDFVIASVPYANFKRLFAHQLRAEKLPPFFLPFLRLAALLELGLHHDKHIPSKYIGKITKPVLLMAATHDKMVNKQDAKHLFDLANDPKHFWQADTGHVIFKEKPEEFKKQVLGFLDRYVV